MAFPPPRYVGLCHNAPTSPLGAEVGEKALAHLRVFLRTEKDNGPIILLATGEAGLAHVAVQEFLLSHSGAPGAVEFELCFLLTVPFDEKERAFSRAPEWGRKGMLLNGAHGEEKLNEIRAAFALGASSLYFPTTRRRSMVMASMVERMLYFDVPIQPEEETKIDGWDFQPHRVAPAEYGVLYSLHGRKRGEIVTRVVLDPHECRVAAISAGAAGTART